MRCHFPIFVLLRLGEAGLYCVITHSNTFDYLVYLKIFLDTACLAHVREGAPKKP